MTNSLKNQTTKKVLSMNLWLEMYKCKVTIYVQVDPTQTLNLESLPAFLLLYDLD